MKMRTCSKSGCTDSDADNYDDTAVVFDSAKCIIGGCNVSDAFNYLPKATYNDGSCIPEIGMFGYRASNYDSTKNTDDGSCVYCNYNTLGKSGCINNETCHLAQVGALPLVEKNYTNSYGNTATCTGIALNYEPAAANVILRFQRAHANGIDGLSFSEDIMCLDVENKRAGN